MSNNIRNSIVVCVYSVVRCLSVRCLAIHVTIFWLLMDVIRGQYACEFVTDIVTLIAVVFN
jgi:hypothetical protein